MNKISSVSALVLATTLVGCTSNDQSVLPVKVTPVAVSDEDIIPIDVRTDTPMPVEPNGGIGDGAVPLTELLEKPESEPIVSSLENTAPSEMEISSLEGTGARTLSYDTTHPTPKGITEMTTIFTLDNEDRVLFVELIGDPAHGTSLKHHADYQVGLNEIVIGQSVLEITDVPGKMNGSSLTSIGFKQALEKLKADV